MDYNVNKEQSMMKMPGFAAAAAFVLVTLVSVASAQEFSISPKARTFAQQTSNNSAANAMFNGARDLIDDAQWIRAEQKFAQYISSFPQEKNLDQAMYWLAYSQYKLRKFNQSKETIDKLLKTYEKTQWKEDAELLRAQLPGQVNLKIDPVSVSAPGVSVKVDPGEVQVQTPEIQAKLAEAQSRMAEAQARSEERAREAQQRTMERVRDAQEKMKDKFDYDFNFDFDFSGKDKGSADDDPSEFKIVVLQALFQSDVQRGISVATDWLKPGSTETVTCKRAALRLLARHGGKAVMPTILRVAQNETDLKLRTTAISLLGSMNDDSLIDPLRDFGLNSQQTEISEAAIYALSQITSDRAATVLGEIAVSNKPISLKRMAISSISGRQGEAAVDALFRIYDSSQELEIRKAVISGLSRRKSPRAGTKLMEIARSAENIEFRKAAISAIGRRGGDTAVDALTALYDSEKNEELKDQIMNALSFSNDQRVTRKFIAIARNPQTPIERRRRAIMLLSNRSKDPEVLAFLEELLKQ
ncbi:MAG: HEAT repeat domain-containing protein [Pyrinomonadaceae bacterium]